MKAAVQNLVETNAKLKNAYFWKGGNAYSRTQIEEKYSVPKIEFEFNGVHYSAEISVRCSRNSVYVSRYFYRDGHVTTITVFKNLLKAWADDKPLSIKNITASTITL